MIRLLNQMDQEQVLDYIERNHMETTFLNASVRGFGLNNDRVTRRCGDYYGYFAGSELKGILPFYNVGSCIPHFEADEAIDAFIEVMKGKQFESLLGMRNYIHPLYKGLASSKEIVDYSESSYLINRSFKPGTATDGIFHNADGQDDETVEFIANAFRKGFNQALTPGEVRVILNQKLPEEDFVILKVDGKIAAQANIHTYTSKINQIGAVYTSEGSRGKGYCKAIVSELCRRIRERGKVPTLFVKKNNAPAVQAYHSIGFEQYEDYLMVKYKK